MHTWTKIRISLIVLALLLLAACNQPAPTSEPTSVVVISLTPLPTNSSQITLTPAEAPTEFPTLAQQPTGVTSASATPTQVITNTPSITQTQAATATMTPTIDLTPSRTPIVESNAFALGAHVFGFAHFPQMRQAGMTWLKLQIRWDGKDPASAVQPQINSVRAGGFKVLLSVVGIVTPAWRRSCRLYSKVQHLCRR